MIIKSPLVWKWSWWRSSPWGLLSNKELYSRKRLLFPTHWASLAVRPPRVCQPCYVIHLYPESGSQSKMLCLKPVRNTHTSSHTHCCLARTHTPTAHWNFWLHSIQQNSIRRHLPWREYKYVNTWDMCRTQIQGATTDNTHPRLSQHAPMWTYIPWAVLWLPAK